MFLSSCPFKKQTNWIMVEGIILFAVKPFWHFKIDWGKNEYFMLCWHSKFTLLFLKEIIY